MALNGLVCVYGFKWVSVRLIIIIYILNSLNSRHMTYSKNANAGLRTQTQKNPGSPSPEVLKVKIYKIVPRDLKLKPIALGEIKKVAEVLDFYSDE
jgi:hypothetical protein